MPALSIRTLNMPGQLCWIAGCLETIVLFLTNTKRKKKERKKAPQNQTQFKKISKRPAFKTLDQRMVKLISSNNFENTQFQQHRFIYSVFLIISNFFLQKLLKILVTSYSVPMYHKGKFKIYVQRLTYQDQGTYKFVMWLCFLP